MKRGRGKGRAGGGVGGWVMNNGGEDTAEKSRRHNEGLGGLLFLILFFLHVAFRP